MIERCGVVLVKCIKLELNNRNTLTTELVDKFLKGHYTYLVLGTYRFTIGKKKHKGKKIPENVFVSFYIPKTPDLEEIERLYKFPRRFKSNSGNKQMSHYTMTEMKMMLGENLVYSREYEYYSDITSILKETFEDNFDEIRGHNVTIVRLNRPFIIRAQDSSDYYVYGYGLEYHPLYVTHAEFMVF